MSNDPSNKKQEEIEKLLEQFKSSDDPAVADASGESGAGGLGGGQLEPTGGETLSPDEIQAMLEQSQTLVESKSLPAQESSPPAISDPASQTNDSENGSNDIDYLLRLTKEALDSIDSPSHPALEGLAEFKLEEFPGSPPSTDHATLDLLRDVELDLKIELGRTQMFLEEVLRLKRGSVVPLDKLAGDPVDVYVNGRLVARGEVLVLNDNFCVRVAELISGNDVD